MDNELYFIINKKTPFKDEKTFTTRFGQEIKKRGGFRHKISDMDRGYKPADAIVAFNGKTYLIEFKVGSEKKQTDLFKKLRFNQIVGLSQRYSNGGISLIIYYNKIYHKFWIVKFEKQDEIILHLNK